MAHLVRWFIDDAPSLKNGDAPLHKPYQITRGQEEGFVEFMVKKKNICQPPSPRLISSSKSRCVAQHAEVGAA